MLFSTGSFVFLFLPISLIGYQLLSRLGRPALLSWLALISLLFYGVWNPVYLLLLVASIVINYMFSLLVAPTRTEEVRSRWLTLGVVANLLLLTYYKYLFPLLGFFYHHGFTHHDAGGVLLPLGISFFTFTQIAYLIDLRQGLAKTQGLLTYTVFVTFFPHLIAGPIIHPREIMPQLEDGRLGPLRLNDIALGLSWFVFGLAKKVLVADQIAPRANLFYASPASYGLAATWVGTLCYIMQLYFDFSGYSDMAVGLARMFSLEFPYNFNSPFKAASIIDFWSRFHMTLSRYLAEYLYTPMLRGVTGRRLDQGKKVNRKGQATLEGYVQMVLYPTMTTMFIAGIWHGAGLQYIVFGMLHGMYLAINHAWRIFTPKGSPLHAKLPVSLSVVINFVAVLVASVFFRASDIHQAWFVVSGMAGRHGRGADSFNGVKLPIAEIIGCFVILWAFPNTQEILGQLKEGAARLPSLFPRLLWQPTVLWSVMLTLLFCASILMFDSSTSFLYFQF